MQTNRKLLDVDELPRLFPEGVARAAELVSLGFSGHAIQSRCGPRGPWQRLQPDVVLLSDAPPNRLQRLRAALRVADPEAVVTGREAMWLNGIQLPPMGAVHVVVPSGHRTRSDGSVTIERTLRMPDPLWRKGFPTAPLARATVDACRRTPTAGEIRVLVLEAVHRGGVALAELHEELALGPSRGTTLLRRVLAEIDRGVRSAGARIATELIDRAGLPQPRWTARLSTRHDVHLAIVDAWWDNVAFAWDADIHRPWAPRTGLPALTRAARLTAAGIVAIHTDPIRIRLDTAAVAEELRGAYRLAAARPRPEVVMS
ncbi:hypothetical protein [Actinokineospora sp. NBRC 105648]|uniref:hypothetical protein n=1 Tax=Actinokineospora sp. NBRC 105648 TaxID=3032206 RepID=UPI0025530A99|nr:hypothetical protein [Actinokineospora sp. NBRC 105648]